MTHSNNATEANTKLSMLNFENHVPSAAAGREAAMTMSKATSASMAVTERPICSPQLGGSHRAEKPTKLRMT